MSTYQISGSDPSEDEAAAIGAIIALVLAEEAASTIGEVSAPAASWRNAAKLMTNGLLPMRTATPPRWNTIDRLRRADRGGSGVTGL